MVWYTFRDDILELPSQFVSIFYRHKKSEPNDVVKEYFEIIIYFVQPPAMIKISILLDITDYDTDTLQQIEKYIVLILATELSCFSIDLCPLKGLTTTHKFY